MYNFQVLGNVLLLAFELQTFITEKLVNEWEMEGKSNIPYGYLISHATRPQPFWELYYSNHLGLGYPLRAAYGLRQMPSCFGWTGWHLSPSCTKVAEPLAQNSYVHAQQVSKAVGTGSSGRRWLQSVFQAVQVPESPPTRYCLYLWSQLLLQSP